MRHPFSYEEPKCAEVGGDFWFPEKATDLGGSSVEVQMAKKMCFVCPHKAECMQWGLHKEYHGIWGGLTERERRIIRVKENIIVREVHVVRSFESLVERTDQGNAAS